MNKKPLTRRHFLTGAATAGAVFSFGCTGPAISRSAVRPVITHGVQSGDIRGSGIVWSRADRDALMHVEVSATESFGNAQRLPAVAALADSDFTAKVKIPELPAGQQMFYRVKFTNIDDDRAESRTVIGQFRSPPNGKQDIRFAWSGDTAGQGWGIDVARGGMRTYASIEQQDPDFFIHCGDGIYADVPILPEVKLPSGGIWQNRVTDSVGKVAETLEQYRGRWRYNLSDAHLQSFNARVPSYYTWDDHDVTDNWSPSTDLADDPRYQVQSVELLAARARRAFNEMLPVQSSATNPAPMYRKVSYGPLLDVFMLDLRSYRGANDAAFTATSRSPDALLGAEQLSWLMSGLKNSRATWKVLVASQPIGLPVWNDWKTKKGTEGVADGLSGQPTGREQEIAKILNTMKTESIQNVVWLCADVHYTAAHHYHPDRADFKEFDPFWEFVSGPLHAGTFPQSELDSTFGPEVEFVKAPTEEQGVNLSPGEGMQFFGLVDIDGSSERMTVRLMDRNNVELYRKTLLAKTD